MDSGCKTQKKIHAVKHWLSQAEQHFGVNSPARGKMDLLLAEAELRSTRDAVEAGSSGFDGAWGRHFVAFGIVVLLVAAGASSLWLRSGNNHDAAAVQQTTFSSVTQTAIPVPVSAPMDKELAPPVRKTETATIAGVDAQSPTQEVKRTETAVAPQTVLSPLSPEEMKRLVQTAGQTLRGRANP